MYISPPVGWFCHAHQNWKDLEVFWGVCDLKHYRQTEMVSKQSEWIFIVHILCWVSYINPCVCVWSVRDGIKIEIMHRWINLTLMQRWPCDHERRSHTTNAVLPYYYKLSPDTDFNGQNILLKMHNVLNKNTFRFQKLLVKHTPIIVVLFTI